MEFQSKFCVPCLLNASRIQAGQIHVLIISVLVWNADFLSVDEPHDAASGRASPNNRTGTLLSSSSYIPLHINLTSYNNTSNPIPTMFFFSSCSIGLRSHRTNNNSPLLPILHNILPTLLQHHHHPTPTPAPQLPHPTRRLPLKRLRRRSRPLRPILDTHHPHLDNLPIHVPLRVHLFRAYTIHRGR